MGNLNNIFNPGNIALIGATDKEGSVGKVALSNLLQSKDRKIFPVNPNRKELLGVECFSSVERIRGKIDLAVIATPAKEVPGIVEECGRAGIGGAVIFSAGFREAGEEGRSLEHLVTAAGKKHSIRILGPNCLGFVRPNAGLNATFIRTSPKPGHIAFVSQSGALGSAILNWAVDKHVGFSMFASLGAMSDVDFGDVIDFLGSDDDTRSILLYMEGVGNGKKFLSAARAFALRKPIIILKPGRYAESSRAAMSHTGAMAGDDAIYEAAFKRAGVVRVKEIADLFNAAEILDSRKLPRGPRLAIVTAAGGPGVMATDALADMGGELAVLSDKSMQDLNRFLPPFWSRGNPIDLIGDADAVKYSRAIRICLSDPGVDGVLVVFVPGDIAYSDKVAQAVIDSAKNSVKPVITAWMGGSREHASRQMLAQNDIPHYETPEEAVRAYVNMYSYKRNLELLYETPAELPLQRVQRKEELKAIIKRVKGEGRTLLNEQESKEFLESYGIHSTVPYIARNAEEAVAFAGETGYPAVIKIVSPDISHKSDIGGVAAGIRSDDEMRQAFAGMTAAVKEKAGDARIEGISVQKMIADIDYELILGSKKDRDFGSVILFGTGGIMAELIRDFSIGLPPLTHTLAKRLIEDTKAHLLIKGWRGKQPVNPEALETVLVNFSYLVVDFPEIAEIDINPLAASMGKLFALDARIILDGNYTESGRMFPHLAITPYPARFIMLWRSKDGTEMVLRPIRPEDEPLEREFLSTLSDESHRTRFFSLFPKISHEWFVMYCNIDYDRHIAMVAEVRGNEKRKIAGVARLILTPDYASGEFALLVHDLFQGKGLGQKLTEEIIRIAKWKGVKEIYGDVLTNNERMLTLCRKLGFSTEWLPGGTTRIFLSLKQRQGQKNSPGPAAK